MTFDSVNASAIAAMDITSLASATFTQGFSQTELDRIDLLVSNFMQSYAVPGMSIALTQAGGLVYAKGVRVVRKRNSSDIILASLVRVVYVLEAAVGGPIRSRTLYPIQFGSPPQVTICSRFRIASVSKLITATA